MFGLQERYYKIIEDILKRYRDVHKVLVYGSRAKGNHTDRSDLDLVIVDGKIDRHTLGNILMDINESDFPYTVDLQVMDNIRNEDLKAHINRVGKIFFEQ